MPDGEVAAMRIGIDFDNTLVDYDCVFLGAAKARGLVDAAFCGSKRAVRDAIRSLPDGELAWQRLQGYVYGAGIGDAIMFNGVDLFLRECRARGVDVFVVSHKTQFGHHDPMGVDLRQAARDWMARHGFFCSDGFGIPVERVFFESTRSGKLARIRAIGCTHFIDDLEEVFTDPDFPARTFPILFASTGALPPLILLSRQQRQRRAACSEARSKPLIECRALAGTAASIACVAAPSTSPSSIILRLAKTHAIVSRPRSKRCN